MKLRFLLSTLSVIFLTSNAANAANAPRVTQAVCNTLSSGSIELSLDGTSVHTFDLDLSYLYTDKSGVRRIVTLEKKSVGRYYRGYTALLDADKNEKVSMIISMHGTSKRFSFDYKPQLVCDETFRDVTY